MSALQNIICPLCGKVHDGTACDTTDRGAHWSVGGGSALRESMDAARNTVAYWKEAYEMEREENQRLREKLRETKKYLRDANRGARILSLAFQLATANKVIRHPLSSQNNSAQTAGH